MKTRIDFVSNSSSSSFIVNDVKSFAEKLSEFTDNGNDVFWLSNVKLRFQFANTPQNRKAFKAYIDSFEYRGHEDDKKEVLYGTGYMDSFSSISPDFYDEMKDLDIYAYDDCGSDGVSSLAWLYAAMTAEGIDVSDENTEHRFSAFDGKIPKKVLMSALKQLSKETSS